MGVPFRKRAGEVRLGDAVLGEWIGAPPAHPKTAIQHRAAKRLAEMAKIASWRSQHGIISDLVGWGSVAADALYHLDGIERWRRDRDGILRQLPPGAALPDAVIDEILSEISAPDRLMPGVEAGRLVGLVKIEHVDIERDGRLISTLTPRDETRLERIHRCNIRQRENTRYRVAKHRKNKKNQSPNGVTLETCNIANTCNAPNRKGSVTRGLATLRPGTDAARIVAAIQGGATT
ncbi:MAG: hypothetical protein U1E06_08455, partial [Tabrizicola sp.]|nr:hypothetical protein [Tabrizicola sp.]